MMLYLLNVVTMSEAIGLVLLAAMLGVILLILALQGIFWLLDCLKDMVSALWCEMFY